MQYSTHVLQEYIGLNLSKGQIVHSMCYDPVKKMEVIDFDHLNELEQIELQRKHDELCLKNTLRSQWIESHLDWIKSFIGQELQVKETRYQSKFPNDPIWYMYYDTIISKKCLQSVTSGGSLIMSDSSEWSLVLSDDHPVWVRGDASIEL